MEHAEAIELIRTATSNFSQQLSAIFDQHQPRGGQPFKPEVSAVLSSEIEVNPRSMLELATALCPPSVGAKALDFGCGACNHKEAIANSGYAYTGVDYDASIDPSRIERLATAHESRVIQYDGLTLPFSDNEFDLVWAWSSIEHCVYPEKSFQEIGRVLKPNGLFVGSLPHNMPYHAESAINFTPYGFYLSAKRAGLKAIKIIPNLDGMTFFLKNLTLALGIGDATTVDRVLREKPLINPFLKRFSDLGHVERIPLELHAELCAEFGFIAVKI